MSEQENLSFEDALKELETIVEKLERGEVSLDDAVAAYERGAVLKNFAKIVWMKPVLKLIKSVRKSQFFHRGHSATG